MSICKGETVSADRLEQLFPGFLSLLAWADNTWHDGTYRDSEFPGQPFPACFLGTFTHGCFGASAPSRATVRVQLPGCTSSMLPIPNFDLAQFFTPLLGT
ncbi:hypothetical protein DSO57_1027757 [Entomophthora muscae]|uniref:Uncharacterized protein n=1 Tax=Entomophthora muscae TaxID=34485 RepID=A0ACC2RGC0_9FUNG|nr:hypothetical protein DSO57_1027757 [Entomophthora muscae]